MPQARFRVIKGEFCVRGFQPDGDSLRFEPHNPALFDGLYRGPKAMAEHVIYQLRLEGIDAPETHYLADWQPLGDRARDHLLKSLGVHDIRRSDDQTIAACTPERVPGTILTRGFDPHGRPISYTLLAEETTSLTDGAEVEVDTTLLARTLNAVMLRSGHAYPLLYTSTPPSHRAWLRAQAEELRRHGLGVWEFDSSRSFRLVDRASVSGAHGTLVYPKFFRRCMDYMRNVEADDYPADFPAWLRVAERENDFVLINRSAFLLSELFHQKQHHVTCNADLLDMVFVEK